MPYTVKVQRQQWLKTRPPADKDIRKLEPGFWSRSRAEQERQARIAILSGGNIVDQALGRALLKAEPAKYARVMCCPLAARRFQIFFTSRALDIAAGLPSGVAVTLVDPATAVPFGKLNTIDWRTSHQQLRKRLERNLGPEAVVFGMGEVEADYEQEVWHPHYHLSVFKASAEDLKGLRRRHYMSGQDDVRRMKVRPLKDPAWHSYTSKLVAFRKVVTVAPDGKRSVQRKRLKQPESREFMRYLARRQPAEFLFSLRCSILRKPVPR